MIDSEYLIYYYAHEEYPPSVRKLSDNFKTWLGEFLNYEEFERNDEVGYRVHWTLGSLPHFQVFFWLRVFPAPKQSPHPPQRQ
jgi:hypothetical protein